MRTDLFDFDLPDDRIALEPATPRDAARLLVVRGERLDDMHVRDLPALLRPGDALVFNDTKVIRAALTGERCAGMPRAVISFNLHKRVDEHRWRAFARPAKRLAAGDRIRFGHDGRVCLLGTLDATVSAIGEAGEVELAFSLHGPFLDEAIEALGDPPLPPYIAGKRDLLPDDAERYQTIYARREGAVAAPTAGLHFTDELLAALDAQGHQPAFPHPARGRRHLPARQGGGDERAPHARRVGRDLARDCRRLERDARRGRAHRRGRHHVAAAAGDGGRTMTAASARSPARPTSSSRPAIASRRSTCC